MADDHMFDFFAEDAGRLMDEVGPIFASQDEGVQGAVLGELVAIWLRAHEPSVRPALLAYHVEMIKRCCLIRRG